MDSLCCYKLVVGKKIIKCSQCKEEFENGSNVVVRQIPLNEWDHDGDNRVDCQPVLSLQVWRNSQKQIVDENGDYVSGWRS